MSQNTALNNDNICDLKGQPLAKGPASFIKAVDKLLTVGAYYSTEHEQYRLVSESTCSQIVEAIGPGSSMAIEITASGMMVGSQLVDPNHRNVRLLHDLLVPLNIARFEISCALTPGDLRQAVAALQKHKLNLGSAEGFQEIKIENLPETVSTASRSVVQGEQGHGEQGQGSLDELLGTGAGDRLGETPGEFLSESELLAQQFMDIVTHILANLEQDPETPDADAHPDTTPENIRALREALSRLVEVNPDPADLARLIEHAKRALDLSRDPRSVDLVFSLLKKEAARGSDWKYKAGDKRSNKPPREFKLSLDELQQKVADLAGQGTAPPEPGPSALNNYLGICFFLLGSDPPEALETALVSNLEQALAGRDLTKKDLSLCSAAVASAALDGNRVALDRLLPAFSKPLRTTRPEYLVKFWIRLWESLDAEHRALVWPHLVGDLMEGFDGLPSQVIEEMWAAAGDLDPKAAIMQVSRLECTAALRSKSLSPSLWKVPLTRTYPVHLALMKSSLGPLHGPRLHDQLCRKPLNGLTEILMKAGGEYDHALDGFYLSLIKQSQGDSITADLRRMSVRLIMDGLEKLQAGSRGDEWSVRAVGWLGKLDPVYARPLLERILRDKKFLFLKAWPRECREQATQILADNQEKG